MAEDRLLNRVEQLVAGIRKIDATLKANPPAERRAKLVKLRDEYQTSLKNIQQFGREKLPRAAEGAKISVPTDVMKVVKA